MPAACLPATGIDTWTIALLIAGAAILLLVGIVAVRRSSRGIALGIVPLLLLGVVLAAPAQPARALETAIPDFQIGSTWTAGPDDWVSEPATGQAYDDMEILDFTMVPAGDAVRTVVVRLYEDDGGPIFVELPGTAWQIGLDFEALIGIGATLDAEDALEEAGGDTTGPLPLVMTATYTYADACGRPLQTVVTWSGELPGVVG